eukprot:Protomagalhaensia_sp_Gyna_25__2057@NODE_2102_length_1292_cov_7_035914_g1738_i0_p2_GENE_NODE_2102_length_1292_cov_7_035914_g1738_i0NODE_2102_length_1292_cov_7_035914_g1738_i0_p2_ORF_typecomplete_len113_score0_50_NODE_2102_length_1292_cov_7_035914_g1738_i08831221
MISDNVDEANIFLVTASGIDSISTFIVQRASKRASPCGSITGTFDGKESELVRVNTMNLQQGQGGRPTLDLSAVQGMTDAGIDDPETVRGCHPCLFALVSADRSEHRTATHY